mmetsp:Transcript_49448/g.78231  ORF Transcript_49448/g.78231 Transcript_49448/m.78231 type:complete len:291 (-) Transcript_49448:74-946(-)
MSFLYCLTLSLCVVSVACECGGLGSKFKCSDHGVCKTHSKCLIRTEADCPNWYDGFDSDSQFDKCVCEDGWSKADCSESTGADGTSNKNPFMWFAIAGGMGIIMCICCVLAFAGAFASCIGGGAARSGARSSMHPLSTPAYAQPAYAQPMVQPTVQPFAVPMVSPQAFSTQMAAMPTGQAMPMWNPSAWCDGASAQDRMTWLQQNKGMSVMAAQQQVMSEFPAMFSGGGVSVNMGGGFPGTMGMGLHRWNPHAMCDGSLAEDRAIWLRDNQGMNMEMARQKVMQEFPGHF